MVMTGYVPQSPLADVDRLRNDWRHWLAGIPTQATGLADRNRLEIMVQAATSMHPFQPRQPGRWNGGGCLSGPSHSQPRQARQLTRR